VRRLLLYIAGALGILVILLGSGGYWLIGTTAGARFALTALPAAAGIHLSFKGIEGRLLDRLKLSGVRALKPGYRLEVERVELSWQPRALLSGRLLVRELALAGVRVQDDAPSSRAPLAWPRLSGVITRFGAEVQRLSLKSLTYRRLKSAPVVLDELSGAVSVRDGALVLSRLALALPQGRASGELVMGLVRPSLRADLSLLPAKPLQGMNLFSLQARLAPGKSPEQVAGPLALAGKSGERRRLELTGELGVTQNALHLRGFSLRMPGRRGELAGQGSLILTAGEPLLDLALRVKELDLQSELKRPTSISGTLNLSGSRSRFRGRFALANRGPGWQKGSLSADFQGGGQRVKLAPLSGRLLDGRLAGALELELAQGMRLRGQLSGRGLNPGRLAADWRGVVNLDLAGSLQLPPKGAPRGSLRGTLLESWLRGQELKGAVSAAFVGRRVRVDRLLLAGRGFDLSGSGELDRRLELSARVSDLSRLLPGGAGEIEAAAWLRWRDGLLSGAARGTGSRLAVGGVGAQALTFDAALGEGKGYPLHLSARLAELRAGRVEVAQARLALQGTVARHTLKAELSSPGSEAQLDLAGGYGKGAWRGELSRLSGRDGVGPWRLAAPAALSAGRTGVALSPLVIDGLPGERLELAWELRRPPLSGKLRGGWSGVNLARANGWLAGARLAGGSSGTFDLRLLPGAGLVIFAQAEAQAQVEADDHRLEVQRLTAKVDGGAQGLQAALDLWLAKGEGEAHLLFSSPEPAALALPRKGNLQLKITDLDLALLRPVTPSDLSLDGRLAGALNGELQPGRKLDLKGNAALIKGHLGWHTEGEALDASLDTLEAAFDWRGSTSAGRAHPGLLQLSARAAATGTYTAQGHSIAVSHLTLVADADPHGSRALLDLSLDQGGTLHAQFSSPAPATAGLPEHAEFAASWGGIDPALLKHLLPGALNLKGEFAGQASGRLLPGRLLQLAGRAAFRQGRASWQGTSGELNARLRSAELAFAWQGETLTGTLDLALAEYGQAHGSFLLPVPARLPVAPEETGRVQGALSGRVQEHGFLTALFPGMVQESHGDLDLDLRLGGVWSDPQLSGQARLSQAGAYLPSAGICLSDLGLLVRLSGEEISIDELRAVSGPGEIRGNALVRLKGWRVADYHGRLEGSRFQTVYLPELQLLSSPQLAFQGTADHLTVTGQVLVPEMLVAGPPARHLAAPSSDVVLEGAPAPPRAGFPLLVDGRIHLALGDKVLVKASGIDARLVGEMDLMLKGIKHISSHGEIKVAKGTFKAYGLDLDIVRGRLYYVGEPVSQPTLDILALRTVEEVKAGVTVGGRLNAPVVKLYSEPSMADVDILAYMVLGHPLNSTSGDQASMVAAAAGSLLSFGQSESVQGEIKQRLGLSVLGVETVTPSTAGRMGYQEIPVTPSGQAPAKQPAGESLLTVGKYLTPQLYLSYGRSLITGGSLIKLRYDLLRHWQIETQSGSESGADLYYKLDFN